MAFSQEFPGAAGVGERAAKAWRLPMGAVSPLWAMFGAAAGAGVAFWWMSQWARAVNVEALAGVKTVPAPKPVATPAEIIAEAAPVEAAAIAAPVAEATVAEASALEAVVEDAAAPVAATVIEAAPPPAPDDLTRMVGIGPKLCAALAERGVTRFAEIAAWTAGDLAEVDSALSLKGRAVREAWVAQARRLAADA
jgi:predicted flap endonuclease-1-like 5' DNA nuclease